MVPEEVEIFLSFRVATNLAGFICLNSEDLEDEFGEVWNYKIVILCINCTLSKVELVRV